MKVALCISGHLRNGLENKDLWSEHMENADVFSHLWLTVGNKVKTAVKPGVELGVDEEPLSEEMIESYYSLYSPVSAKMVDIKTVWNQFVKKSNRASAEEEG